MAFGSTRYELRKETCESATRHVLSSIASTSCSNGIVTPSSEGAISTRAPTFCCASQMYCIEGKSSALVTILFRRVETKSKQDATLERAIDAFGCGCTEPAAPPRIFAMRSPTWADISHQLVAQASSLVCPCHASK